MLEKATAVFEETVFWIEGEICSAQVHFTLKEIPRSTLAVGSSSVSANPSGFSLCMCCFGVKRVLDELLCCLALLVLFTSEGISLLGIIKQYITFHKFVKPPLMPGTTFTLPRELA